MEPIGSLIMVAMLGAKLNDGRLGLSQLLQGAIGL